MNKERAEEARYMAQPTIPKDERRRSSYGSLLMSVQSVGGLCSRPRCVRKSAHGGDCWPRED